jgi:hypothetical protein
MPHLAQLSQPSQWYAQLRMSRKTCRWGSFWGRYRGYVDVVRGTWDALRSYSGTESLRVLLWWPALSVIWWAAIPSAGVADVVGIGLGLAILGLVDAMASAWGRCHGIHKPVDGRDALAGQAAAGPPTCSATPDTTSAHSAALTEVRQSTFGQLIESEQSIIRTKPQYVDQ